MVVSCMLIDEQKASLFTRFTGAALRKARGINNSRIGFPKISTLRTRLARVLLMVSFFLPFYAAHSAATVPVTSFCYQLASACNQSNQQSGSSLSYAVCKAKAYCLSKGYISYLDGLEAGNGPSWYTRFKGKIGNATPTFPLFLNDLSWAMIVTRTAVGSSIITSHGLVLFLLNAALYQLPCAITDAKLGFYVAAVGCLLNPGRL